MLRSGVGIVNQIGVEATPGTGVAANRYTPTLNWNLKRKIDTKDFRGRGSRVPTTKVHHKKMATGDVSGVLDYNSIIYLLSGIFNNPASTQIGALQAYSRVYTPGLRTADATNKTYTVEIGDATAAEKYLYTLLTSLSLSANQDDFTVKSDAIARYPTDNVALTASPTTIAERPVERDDISVYMNDTFGTIGTTLVSEALSENLEIASKYKEVFVHNAAAPEFYDVIDTPYSAKFMFETVHNTQSRTLISSLTTNPTKWMRWEAVGKLLGNNGADVYEKITIDMAVKFEEPEPLENEGEPYGYKYNAMTFPDEAGLTSHMKITVINGIAAI